MAESSDTPGSTAQVKTTGVTEAVVPADGVNGGEATGDQVTGGEVTGGEVTGGEITGGSKPPSVAGRSCPVDYRYNPADIAATPAKAANVLYVIGGLYGNSEALKTVLSLLRFEREPVTLCFNGDFNWFNVASDRFRQINTTVQQYDAIRGNVETGLAERGTLTDCGCAYPDFVDDAVVSRSNQIIGALHQTALQHSDLQDWMRGLPRYRRYEVAGHSVAIVHGDPEALAGWGLCQETLDEPESRESIARWLAGTNASVIACTHTCLPFLYCAQSGAVINNGASGMPNFRNSLSGLLSRISHSPPPQQLQAIYGARHDELYIDAIPIPYAHAAWISEFNEQWAADSPAHLSYFDRLMGAIDYTTTHAVRWLSTDAKSGRHLRP